jgi:hypothetical protein
MTRIVSGLETSPTEDAHFAIRIAPVQERVFFLKAAEGAGPLIAAV